MSVADVLKFRHFFLADFFTFRAAGVEFTAGRGIGWGWYVSFKNDAFDAGSRIRNRNRRKQSLGIWMRRILKKLGFLSRFNHRTEIHDPDTVGNVFHDRKIVGYK